MADSMDFSQLDALAQDLTEIPGLINAKAKQAVQHVALNTKKSWAADAKKGPRGGRYAPTIDYEECEFGGFGQGVFEAEIGPNLARYGGKTGKGGLIPSLGILDDPESSGGIRTTPSRARRRAEKFAAKDLVKGIEIAVEQSLKKAGL